MVDRSERIRLIAELRDELGELSYDDAELVMEEFGLGFMTTNDWEFERSRELGRLLRAATDDDLVSLGSHLSSETVKDAAHVRAEGREHELDVSPGLVENLRRQADDWVEPERGRRLDDEHYRAVAVVYSSALAAGRNPLRASSRRRRGRRRPSRRPPDGWRGRVSSATCPRQIVVGLGATPS